MDAVARDIPLGELSSHPLRLVAGDGGWSLMTQAGEVVFGAIGPEARRLCLEFAERQGVLAIFS